MGPRPGNGVGHRTDYILITIYVHLEEGLGLLLRLRLRIRVVEARALRALCLGLLPDRSPSLEPIAGAVSGYLKTQGGVSKSQGQCEA